MATKKKNPLRTYTPNGAKTAAAGRRNTGRAGRAADRMSAKPKRKKS